MTGSLQAKRGKYYAVLNFVDNTGKRKQKWVYTGYEVKNNLRKSRKPASKLKIIPLGGLEQIGMNITAFEYEDSIVVVDCG